MKKVIKVLKKYLGIAFAISIAMCIWDIVFMIRSNILPNVDVIYILKVLSGILPIAIVLMPLVALMDLLLIKSGASLIKDFKESDRKGRMLLVIIFIILLLKQIFLWNKYH